MTPSRTTTPIQPEVAIRRSRSGVIANSGAMSGSLSLAAVECRTPWRITIAPTTIQPKNTTHVTKLNEITR